MKIHNNFNWLIAFFIAYVSLVNIFNVFLFSISDNAFFINVAPASKDLLFILISFIIVYYTIFKAQVLTITTIHKLILLYALLVIVSAFFSDATFNFIAFNIRRILEFFIIVLVFSWVSLSYRQYAKLLNFTFLVGAVVFIIGLVLMIAPISFWDVFLKFPKYYSYGSYVERTIGSISQTSAYTSDLYFLTGERFPRMLSTYVEPTTLGSFFTFLFVYALFSNTVKYRNLYLPMFFIGGILLFSKAFLLSVMIAMIFKLHKKNRMILVYFILGSLFVLSAYIALVLGRIHGGLSHFIGFYTGFELLLSHPFGFGLGSAGNRGEFASGVVTGQNGGESGLGNIFAQIGLVGVMVPLILFKLLNKFSEVYRKSESSDYFSIFVATFVWVVIFCLSASSLGLTGNYIFFIFIGLLLNEGTKNAVIKNL